MIEEWTLKISKIDNGYILEGNRDEEGNYLYMVIEETDDELKAPEQLLRGIMEYFSLLGSKHDVQRLQIVRQKKREG